MARATCTEGPHAGVGLPSGWVPEAGLCGSVEAAAISLPLPSAGQHPTVSPCSSSSYPTRLLSPPPPLDPPGPLAGSEPPEVLAAPASVPSLSPDAGDWAGVGPGLECAVLRSPHLPPPSLSFPTCDTFWGVRPSIIVSDGTARPSTALDVPNRMALEGGHQC